MEFENFTFDDIKEFYDTLHPKVDGSEDCRELSVVGLHGMSLSFKANGNYAENSFGFKWLFSRERFEAFKGELKKEAPHLNDLDTNPDRFSFVVGEYLWEFEVKE